MSVSGIPDFHSDEYIKRMNAFLLTYKIPKVAKTPRPRRKEQQRQSRTTKTRIKVKKFLSSN